MCKNKGIHVGKYNLEFDKILRTSVGEKDIYQPYGLTKHMLKKEAF